MKDKKLFREYLLKKAVLIAAHVFGVLLFAVGVVAIYSNTNFHKGISTLNQEAYEESDSFNTHFNEDMNYVFDYLNTKEIFENRGHFDLAKPIFSISEGPAVDTEYTVEDVIATAKRRGYYLDDEYQIVSVPDIVTSADAETSYIVNWKTYQNRSMLSEPSDSYMTIDELIQEVLEMLGKYYKAYDRLILKETNFSYHIEYHDHIFTNNKALSEMNASQMGKYAIVEKDVLQIDSNIKSIPPNLQYLAENCIYNDGAYYIAVVAVDTEYKVNDIYARESHEYAKQREMYFNELLIICAGLVIMLISLILLVLVAVKHRDDFRNNRLPHPDTSFEGVIFACALSIIVLLFLNEKVFSRLYNIYLSAKYAELATKATGYVLVYACVVVAGFRILRSYLAEDIWTKSLTKKWYDTIDKYIDENTFSRRLTIVFTAFVLIDALMIWVAALIFSKEQTLIERFIGIALLLVFVAGNIAALLILQKKMTQQDKIDSAVKTIAGGDTGYQLNLEEFDGKERKLAENLNNIGAGLDTALSEQMRSERLKTDLITNVSHDIKTPLTSIINYIDLIKREHPTDPKIVEYLQVLEQKSQHLKNLTEDLVEASKVSSGNVSLDMQLIDFNEMVQQANGEFEEKFALRSLQIVSGLPKTPVMIQADGNSLWRVLENIYNNAFKYAAEGSRVYVDMTVIEDPVPEGIAAAEPGVSGNTAKLRTGAVTLGNTAKLNTGAVTLGNTAKLNTGAVALGNTAKLNTGAVTLGNTAKLNTGAVTLGNTAKLNTGAVTLGNTAKLNTGAVTLGNTAKLNTEAVNQEIAEEVVSGGTVIFTMKNISSNPLNISADELTERFVRGDVSRSTEGSGLGLSIAESLTRMQGGTFQIAIDGDLFKAIISFRKIEKQVGGNGV